MLTTVFYQAPYGQPVLPYPFSHKLVRTRVRAGLIQGTPQKAQLYHASSRQFVATAHPRQRLERKLAATK
ncbi:MAG TPA: hypothetical protein VL461_15060 [Dictyobacter sp.]|jgi:hypothetical protein|nr:hypothetical protein [Dictyobacter sp.]